MRASDLCDHGWSPWSTSLFPCSTFVVDYQGHGRVTAQGLRQCSKARKGCKTTAQMGANPEGRKAEGGRPPPSLHRPVACASIAQYQK
jgi:hypothetical protein